MPGCPWVYGWLAGCGWLVGCVRVDGWMAAVGCWLAGWLWMGKRMADNDWLWMAGWLLALGNCGWLAARPPLQRFAYLRPLGERHWLPVPRTPLEQFDHSVQELRKNSYQKMKVQKTVRIWTRPKNGCRRACAHLSSGLIILGRDPPKTGVNYHMQKHCKYTGKLPMDTVTHRPSAAVCSFSAWHALNYCK